MCAAGAWKSSAQTMPNEMRQAYGKTWPGRPGTTWRRLVDEEILVSWKEFEAAAQDRRKWGSSLRVIVPEGQMISIIIHHHSYLTLFIRHFLSFVLILSMTCLRILCHAKL